MEEKSKVLDNILAGKLVAVVRGKDKEEGSKIIDACREAKLSLIEITYTNKDASELIKKYSMDEELCVGAGTVVNVETAKNAIESGAKFIVGPNFDEDLAVYCNENEILYIPGCLTPTEIIRAQKYNCKIVKLFPGELVGPKYIKAIKAPIPDIKIMVTGGVDKENINQWLENGAEALGIGSLLTKDTDLQHDNIVSNAKEFLEKVK